MMSISFDLAFNLLISYFCIFDGLAAAHSNAVWKKQRRETQERRKPIQLSSSQSTFFPSSYLVRATTRSALVHNTQGDNMVAASTAHFFPLGATSKWAWVCAGCSPLPKSLPVYLWWWIRHPHPITLMRSPLYFNLNVMPHPSLDSTILAYRSWK